MENLFLFIINIEKKTYNVYNTIEQMKKMGGMEQYMATKNKNVWILLLFILCGLVLGGFLGELASKVDFLWWVSYGEEFGLSTPVTLDLNIIKLTIGCMFKINISSIIGLILAIYIYIEKFNLF